MTTPMTKEALAGLTMSQLAERNAEYVTEIAAKDKRIAELERDETKLIEERDIAEHALSKAYEAVTDFPPEWSNWFGFADAVEEIGEICEQWRKQGARITELQSRAESAEQKLSALSVSHSKLRDTMAAIHNTIRMDGINAPMASIMNNAKRAHEESATAADILQIQGGE